MSQLPSRSSPAAFLSAATAASRRTVMLPAVSVPVMKNHMGRPVRRSVTDVNSNPIAAYIIQEEPGTPTSGGFRACECVRSKPILAFTHFLGSGLGISCEYAADNAARSTRNPRRFSWPSRAERRTVRTSPPFHGKNGDCGQKTRARLSVSTPWPKTPRRLCAQNVENPCISCSSKAVDEGSAAWIAMAKTL
jgi:hypothetical protein